MKKQGIMDETLNYEGQIKNEIAEMIDSFFILHPGSISKYDWLSLISQILDTINAERK